MPEYEVCMYVDNGLHVTSKVWASNGEAAKILARKEVQEQGSEVKEVTRMRRIKSNA
jgi:hypothetical protein